MKAPPGALYPAERQDMKLKWYLTSADTPNASTVAHCYIDGVKYAAFASTKPGTKGGDGVFGVALCKDGYPDYRVISRVHGGRDAAEKEAEDYIAKIGGTAA